MEILSNIVYYVIPFIVLLGILVFVHEFGHFIVARRLGVTVVAFSIGFGKELWSTVDKKGTRWKISAIPLGGYCQFLGDADASSSTIDESVADLPEEAKKGAFHLQKTWKKICIVVAGPLFNYLFAILLFIGLFYSFGKMVIPPIVGQVMPDTAAAEAGIVAGDKILNINGRETPDFQALGNEVALAEQDEVEVNVERLIKLNLSKEEIENLQVTTDQLKCVEEINGKSCLPFARIEKYDAESNIAKAGLTEFNKIYTIDGTEVNTAEDLFDYVSDNSKEVYEMQVYCYLTLKVMLRDTKYENENGQKVKRRMLGVVSTPELSVAEEMSFPEAVVAGFAEAYDLTESSLRGIGQMLTGARASKDVGGIIRIAEMSGDVSKSGGLLSFIYFMALLSVNLGLLNLFPIPVLDGGSLVIYLIELVIGRELNAKIKDYIFKFGLFIVLALMVLATWNDITHLISRWFD